MKKNTNSNAILSIFIFGLFVLLLNDFYLKELFHNGFTGKLSDFAGLLIFPWFWSLIFQKRPVLIYLFTAVFFIYWKTAYSDSFIFNLNGTLETNFSRVLDITDLVALSVLPFSYRLSDQSKNSLTNVLPSFKYGIAFLCCFSFFATSQPRVYIEPAWEFNQNYNIPYSKEKILLDHMQFVGDSTQKNKLLSYTAFNLNIYEGEFSFDTDIKILPIDTSKSILVLTRLNKYVRTGISNKKKAAITREEFLKIFEEEILARIKGQPKSPANLPFTIKD